LQFNPLAEFRIHTLPVDCGVGVGVDSEGNGGGVYDGPPAEGVGVLVIVNTGVPGGVTVGVLVGGTGVVVGVVVETEGVVVGVEVTDGQVWELQPPAGHPDVIGLPEEL
jgi:hypothetical protein